MVKRWPRTLPGAEGLWGRREGGSCGEVDPSLWENRVHWAMITEKFQNLSPCNSLLLLG